MEAVIAERKAFLSKKKLTYICRFKVDEPAKEVRFFEMLKESGFGVASGGCDGEMSSGFGFKKETYNTFGKERRLPSRSSRSSSARITPTSSISGLSVGPCARRPRAVDPASRSS